MEMQFLGDGVPAEVERAARVAVMGDERARGIVTDGIRFDIRITPRLFAGERMVALVVPVIDGDETAPVFVIEEG